MKAYLWIDNIILEDNLVLNLYIMFTTCYIIVILEDQKLARRRFLVNLSQKSIREFLVNFQTRNYRVFYYNLSSSIRVKEESYIKKT